MRLLGPCRRLRPAGQVGPTRVGHPGLRPVSLFHMWVLLCAHIQRCVRVVIGYAVERRPRGGRWGVHISEEREKVVTHTHNALKGCMLMTEIVL